MDQNLSLAILAGLGGMLGWGLADFFAKKSIDEAGSIVSLVWSHLFGTIFLGLIVLYQVVIRNTHISIPTSSTIWLGLLFFGALQAVVYLLAYEGFGKGKLAIINPIFASYSGLAALLSIFIFKEVVSSSLIVSLVIIFLGVLLLNVDSSALKLKKIKLMSQPGVKEILFASLLAAFWQLFWDKLVSGQDWIFFTFCMYAFMSLTAFGIAKSKKIALTIKNASVWKFLVLVGVCEGIAYLSLSLGLSATSYTSIVIVIAGAFSLPTIILARIFLKEQVTRLQTIGSIVIIAGVMLLSLL